jgi:hypothetical protein
VRSQKYEHGGRIKVQLFIFCFMEKNQFMCNVSRWGCILNGRHCIAVSFCVDYSPLWHISDSLLHVFCWLPLPCISGMHGGNVCCIHMYESFAYSFLILVWTCFAGARVKGVSPNSSGNEKQFSVNVTNHLINFSKYLYKYDSDI